MMAGSQEWLSKTMVGSRAQPTGRMVASSQDCPGSICRQNQKYKPCDLKFEDYKACLVQDNSAILLEYKD
jgi:hypothetical protein